MCKGLTKEHPTWYWSELLLCVAGLTTWHWHPLKYAVFLLQCLNGEIISQSYVCHIYANYDAFK